MSSSAPPPFSEGGRSRRSSTRLGKRGGMAASSAFLLPALPPRPRAQQSDARTLATIHKG
eukprot:3448031-Pyramimonas_sp.AAC.1